MKSKAIILISFILLFTVMLGSCKSSKNGGENGDTSASADGAATIASSSDTTASSSENVDTATKASETLAGVSDDDLNIVFINSGRSDSILLMAAGKAYMIDTGEKGKDNFKSTNNILKIYNVKTLSGVFLTHTHSDHIGGMKRLAEKYKIECVYSARLHTENDKIDELTSELELPHTLLGVGEKFVITEDIYFDVLSPTVLDYREENNNSLVMMLYAYGKKILFTGDMEFPQETTLMDAGADLKADVLKVANHGNPDASSTKFLKAVSPEYAVICTDRSEDEDSANKVIIDTLPDTKFYITDEYALGVFLKIDPQGTISVETK